MARNLDPSKESIDAILAAIATKNNEQTYSGTYVVNLDNGLFVKYGYRVKVTEALAMEYVRARTTIPIPKVHMTFAIGDVGYIVMDLVEGEIMARCEGKLTRQNVHDIALELLQYIDQLRNLEESPHITMGSWPSGPYKNFFFSGWEIRSPSQEYHLIEQFHAFWMMRLPAWYKEKHRNLMGDHQNYPIVLSHGDLGPGNVIVKDGKITGIIDWETFGWYPDFWELVALLRQAFVRNWDEEVVAALGGCPKIVDQYVTILRDVWEND